MKSFLFILVLGILVLKLLLPLTKKQDRARELNRAFKQIARTYGGSFRPGGLFGLPKAAFRHNGSQVVVSVVRSGNLSEPFQTLLKVRWPEARLRCEVHERSLPGYMQQWIGLHEIPTGDAEFDRRFRVSGNNPREVTDLLNEGVRQSIGLLRERESGRVSLSIRFGEFILHKAKHFRRPEDLQQFVGWGLILWDQAQLARAAGITFVPETDDPAEREIICQVCGEAIRHDMVHCLCCHTPHHRDCWEYFGSCSIYGCRCTQYTQRVAAAPPEPEQAPR